MVAHCWLRQFSLPLLAGGLSIPWVAVLWPDVLVLQAFTFAMMTMATLRFRKRLDCVRVGTVAIVALLSYSRR